MSEKLKVTLTNTCERTKSWVLRPGGTVTLSAGEAKPLWLVPAMVEAMGNTADVKVEAVVEPEPQVEAVVPDEDLELAEADRLAETVVELAEVLTKEPTPKRGSARRSSSK